MTDWATTASLATAASTFVLALVTLAAVRSANRSARTAEVALQEQRRPVFMPSRLGDPMQKIMFVDQHWVRVDGGRGSAEHLGDVVYLVMSLRNVASGIGVLQGWSVAAGLQSSVVDHVPIEAMRRHTRDLYIPAGDIGLWQGALRDPTEPVFADVVRAIDERDPLSIDLLYTDQVGAQRTVSRFVLMPAGEGSWIVSSGRHWYLDTVGPR